MRMSNLFLKQACPSRVEQSLRALHASLAAAKLWVAHSTWVKLTCSLTELTLGQSRRVEEDNGRAFLPSCKRSTMVANFYFNFYSFSSFLFHLTICMFVFVSVQFSLLCVWSHCVWHLKNAWQHLMLLLLSNFFICRQKFVWSKKRINDFLIFQKKRRN